jgi:hypothetical protein
MSSSSVAAANNFLDMTNIQEMISKALTDFVSKIEKKYEIKVPETAWDCLCCQVLLQSGPRRNQACGKPLKSGQEKCATHMKSKNPAPLAGSVTPAAPVKPDLQTPIRAITGHPGCFLHGPSGFVIQKVESGKKEIVGSLKDDKIVPLTADDRKQIRGDHLLSKYLEEEKNANVEKGDENVDESEDVVEEVEKDEHEEVEEEVEEIVIEDD